MGGGGGGCVLSREGCLQPSFISASTTQEIGDGGLKEREGGGGSIQKRHVKGYTSLLTTFTILTSSNPNKTLMVLERLSSGKRSTL